MSKKIKIILSYLFIIFWIIFIFYLSSMDNNESNSKSKATINKFLLMSKEIKSEITTGKPSNTNNKNNSKILNLVEILNPVIRKCAHATVYFILSFLLLNALNFSGMKGKKKYLIAIILCFLYAITDEYHQTFVDGRSPRRFDIMIDTIGATIGCIFYIILLKIIDYIKKIFKSIKKMNDDKELK